MNDETRDDDALWLDAGLDDELDAERSLALRQRLASDPAFRAAHASRRALRDAVRAGATRHAAPAALQARLAQALAAGGTAPRRPPVRPAWAWLWGAACCGALAASLATWLVLAGPLGHRADGAVEIAQADAAAEAVSAHTRSLLVGQPIEVASSDQHTVRPWLSARLNFVPPIVDLAPQGYALLGARRDVIAGEIAAALVYRHGAHVVSVFIQPLPAAAAAAAADQPARLRVVRGFNVVEMTHAAMAWRLVSDMNQTEMRQLAALLRDSS
jgi:anti-sigma factor RsiW